MAKFGLVIPYVEKHLPLLVRCIESVGVAMDKVKGKISVYPIRDIHKNGVPFLLNAALFEHVKDDYFGYFGADDIMLPNAFKHLENFSGDWCYGDCIQIEDGNKYPYYAGPFDYERLKKENFIPAGSVFVRTEIIKEIMWNEKLTFAEDWEMWLQLGKKYKPTYINQFQYNYSMNTSVFNKSFLRRWNNKRKFRKQKGVNLCTWTQSKN